jgi:hypothetical protein
MRTALLIALLVVGCGKNNEAPKPAPQAADLEATDTCTVKATGPELDAVASRKGGSMAVSSRYWISDAEKAQLGEMPAFTINCDGKSADGKAINVHLIAPADDTVPMKPGKYVVGGKDGTIHRLVSIDRDPIKANGELDITEFDGNHIKGTFKLSGENLKQQAFTLDGTFDLKCHGTKCS